MLFNSLIFVAFAPLFVVVYFSTKNKVRLALLLASSYLFYGWWDWRFLLLIGILTGVTYYAGVQIEESCETRKRRFWLVVSISTSLGAMAFFKYFNFFSENLRVVLTIFGVRPSYGTLNLLLPVAISFYAFELVSYVVDIYDRRVTTERSLLRFAVFVAFWPKLVCGPIIRAADFLPQLRTDRPAEWDRLVRGACMIAWGYVLKSLLADSLAGPVDFRFANPKAIGGLSWLIGILFYAFQIYGDFAGYSLIAIGFAYLLGFDLNRNFDRPYFSASFSEFWQRWHISLSSWLRDYLYIRLGGNRRGIGRTFLNLMTTMFLGGLWHGASWTFVAWGGIHGFYLCVERAVSAWLPKFGQNLAKQGAIWRGCRVGLVFVLTCVAWVFFRARTFSDATTIFSKIANVRHVGLGAVDQPFEVVKGTLLIGALLLVDLASLRLSFASLVGRWPVLSGAFLIGCAVSLALFGTFGESAFIYLQF